MGRSLTSGEIAAARSVFKDSINYSKVKIYETKFFFGQPNNSGMTPRGEIHAHGFAYHEDYSLEMPETQAFFIHEMCHVWQHQNKILNCMWSAFTEQIRHGFKYENAYPYFLEADKTLLDYGMEQQASMIEDYYRVVKRGITFRGNRCQNKGTDTKKRALLISVLGDFLNER